MPRRVNHREVQVAEVYAVSILEKSVRRWRGWAVKTESEGERPLLRVSGVIGVHHNIGRGSFLDLFQSSNVVGVSVGEDNGPDG